MPVLRQVVGETLRGLRLRQRRTLREVSATARVSLGYLSEVERGQKEPSSELLAAICGALDVELSELFREVSRYAAPRGEAGAGQPRRARRQPVARGPARPRRPPATAAPAGSLAADRRRLTVEPRTSHGSGRPRRPIVPAAGAPVLPDRGRRRRPHPAVASARGGRTCATRCSTPCSAPRSRRRRSPRPRRSGPAGTRSRAGNAMNRTRVALLAGARASGREQRHEDHHGPGGRGRRGRQGHPLQPLPHPRGRARRPARGRGRPR